MQDKRKKNKMRARRQEEMRKKQRREERYKKIRKKKRKKRQQLKKSTERRKQERELFRASEEAILLERHLPEPRVREAEEGQGAFEAEEELQAGYPQEKKEQGRKNQKGKRQQGRINQKGKRLKRSTYSKRGRRVRRWVNDTILKVAVLFLFLAVLYLYCRPKVVEELVAEAGSPMPELSKFLLQEYSDACFAQEYGEILDMHTVGDYEIKIMVSGMVHTSVLRVADTTAPMAVAKDVQTFKDCAVTPTDFIAQIEDATETTVAFAVSPDVAMPGEQEVELVVRDEGGNATRVSARLEVLEDTEAPVIAGVKELTVAVGDSISYKKDVIVSDNYDADVKLEIDSSEVDLKQEGDYPVTYRAVDAAGNVSVEETVVHVKPPSVEMATEEMVNEKADEILQQITTEDMGQYDIAEAIFEWVHGNIGWSDGTPKTDWIQGAYRGLFELRGDCYVYASASKCLLTRAGIENMDIGFSTARRTHYWNLIDLGSGWHHFDTTRRTDGKAFFYCKDAEIRAYSDAHNGSHAYDPSQYPAIR